MRAQRYIIHFTVAYREPKESENLRSSPATPPENSLKEPMNQTKQLLIRMATRKIFILATNQSHLLYKSLEVGKENGTKAISIRINVLVSLFLTMAKGIPLRN